MATISPFTPQNNATVNQIASTSAQLLQMAGGAGQQIRVINTASVAVYVEFGASTVTASVTSSMPILSNAPQEKFTIGRGGTIGSVPTSGNVYASLIASAATTTPIFFTCGEGF